jgi:hypothetical protein
MRATVLAKQALPEAHPEPMDLAQKRHLLARRARYLLKVAERFGAAIWERQLFYAAAAAQPGCDP